MHCIDEVRLQVQFFELQWQESVDWMTNDRLIACKLLTHDSWGKKSIFFIEFSASASLVRFFIPSMPWISVMRLPDRSSLFRRTKWLSPSITVMLLYERSSWRRPLLSVSPLISSNRLWHRIASWSSLSLDIPSIFFTSVKLMFSERKFGTSFSILSMPLLIFTPISRRSRRLAKSPLNFRRVLSHISNFSSSPSAAGYCGCGGGYWGSFCCDCDCCLFSVVLGGNIVGRIEIEFLKFILVSVGKLMKWARRKEIGLMNLKLHNLSI